MVKLSVFMFAIIIATTASVLIGITNCDDGNKNMIYFPLRNGYKIPAIGYPAWQEDAKELEQGLGTALQLGYRQIDVAPRGKNERMVGKMVQEFISAGNGTRGDFYIVTKMRRNRRRSMRESMRQTLVNLQSDYVDLFEIDESFIGNDSDFRIMVNEMMKMEDEGMTRSIGISSVTDERREMLRRSLIMKWFYDTARRTGSVILTGIIDELAGKGLVEYQQERVIVRLKGILTSARPSDRFRRRLKRMGIEIDNTPIPKKYGKTPNQTLLRYLIQRNISVIPTDTDANQLKENMQVFDFNLNKEDMSTLDRLMGKS